MSSSTSIVIRVSILVAVVCAAFAFVSSTAALEPYAACIQERISVGMSQEAATASCSSQTTTTTTAQEPYAVCIQQKIAAGQNESAAASSCNSQFAIPTPTYSAAYIACVQQAMLLNSGQEASIAACQAQHLSTPAPTRQTSIISTQSTAATTTSTTIKITPITEAANNTQTPTIASLMAEIVRVQAIIAALTGAATNANSCEAFNGLSRGMTSEMVTKAQQILTSQGFLATGNNTGFFGPLTEAAVQAFHAAKGIASSGSPDTTGWGRIGPRTGLALGLCS